MHDIQYIETHYVTPVTNLLRLLFLTHICQNGTLKECCRRYCLSTKNDRCVTDICCTRIVTVHIITVSRRSVMFVHFMAASSKVMLVKNNWYFFDIRTKFSLAVSSDITCCCSISAYNLSVSLLPSAAEGGAVGGAAVFLLRAVTKR